MGLSRSGLRNGPVVSPSRRLRRPLAGKASVNGRSPVGFLSAGGPQSHVGLVLRETALAPSSLRRQWPTSLTTATWRRPGETFGRPSGTVGRPATTRDGEVSQRESASLAYRPPGGARRTAERKNVERQRTSDRSSRRRRPPIFPVPRPQSPAPSSPRDYDTGQRPRAGLKHASAAVPQQATGLSIEGGTKAGSRKDQPSR
jgi:hypothetical protein